MRDATWDAWFSLQYDLLEQFRQEIKDRTRGKSDTFKAAIYSGLIEGLAEDMRQVLSLPTTDAEPELIDGSACATSPPPGPPHTLPGGQ